MGNTNYGSMRIDISTDTFYQGETIEGVVRFDVKEEFPSKDTVI